MNRAMSEKEESERSSVSRAAGDIDWARAKNASSAHSKLP